MKILSIGRRLDYTTKRKYEIKHHRKQHYLKKYIEYFHWQIQSECFTCRSNSKQLFLLIPSSILSANPRTENWLHAPPLLFWENSYDCLLMICFFCDANTWMETGKRYTWVWNQVIHWAAITAQMVMIVGAGKHRRTDGRTAPGSATLVWYRATPQTQPHYRVPHRLHHHQLLLAKSHLTGNVWWLFTHFSENRK